MKDRRSFFYSHIHPSRHPAFRIFSAHRERRGKAGFLRVRGASFYLAVLVVLFATPGFAVEPDEIMSDPALEMRARELSRELRCVTCQSQSIDDSDADLAKDLRLVVRERLLAGDSNDEVVAYVTNRYGDYVRLKPAMRSDTALLWLAPWLALAGAFGVALIYFRQLQKNHPASGNDDENEADDDPSKEAGA